DFALLCTAYELLVGSCDALTGPRVCLVHVNDARYCFELFTEPAPALGGPTETGSQSRSHSRLEERLPTTHPQVGQRVARAAPLCVLQLFRCAEATCFRQLDPRHESLITQGFGPERRSFQCGGVLRNLGERSLQKGIVVEVALAGVCRPGEIHGLRLEV